MTRMFNFARCRLSVWQRVITFSSAVVSVLAMSGCVSTATHSVINTHHEPVVPEQQLADYLTVSCNDIWQLQGNPVESNPLYWLRGIDCARQLTPVEARSLARQHDDDTWQAAFRRGILLAGARITPEERRSYMDILESTTSRVPAQVQPLFLLWMNGQQQELKLFAERGRYNKLRQSTDSELETLRQQELHLHEQLLLTTRKLENLTDIERQLSSRKPTDGSHTLKSQDDDIVIPDAKTDQRTNREKP